MKKSASIILIILASCCLSLGSAQVPAGGDTARGISTISVKSGTGDIAVYDGTAFMGLAPFENYPLKPGVHIFRYVRSGQRSWPGEVEIETVTVKPDEKIEKFVSPLFSCYISSTPEGARIMLADSLLGITPMYVSKIGIQAPLTLSKEGYKASLVRLQSGGSLVHLKLDPLGGRPENAGSFLSKDHESPKLSLYISSGATVAAGAAAAYLKIKADKLYGDYRLNADQGTLDKVHRLDLAAGISLAAFEVSFFILTYLLFSQ